MLSELIIIWVVKLLQAIAMTMGMGVVYMCMYDGWPSFCPWTCSQGAYFVGDGQVGASRLKILICIYVSEENLDFNLAYGSWRTYRLNPDRDSN